MSANTERAEAETRVRMSEADKRKYTGIARHPLARQWMLDRLCEARDKAKATTGAERERWEMERQRVQGELRRMGVGQ